MQNLMSGKISVLVLTIALAASAFLLGKSLTPVFAVNTNGEWVNVGSCVANACGSSAGLQDQSKTTITTVCDTGCPTREFSASHQICPENEGAYTSTDSSKDCKMKFGSGRDQYWMYTDKVTETFGPITVQYEKSNDPNHCHKPTKPSEEVPSWASGDYNSLPNQLDSLTNINCHDVTDIQSRTVACDTAPIVECGTDACPNLDGDQKVVPEGYHLTEGQCIKDEVVDVCSNIPGDQAITPEGYTNRDHICTKNEEKQNDVCTNIDGIQTSVPGGMHLNATGHECVNYELGGPPSSGGNAPQGQVLGASTMAKTGSFEENLYLAIMTIGGTLTALSFKNLKKAFQKA